MSEQSKNMSSFEIWLTKAFIRPYSKFNVWLYRKSGGKLMGSMAGGPVCLVGMTGRKSGKRRTLPLIYNTRGDDVFFIASRGGTPAHPAWYHNMMAYPRVDIQMGTQTRNYSVRQASDEEKAELWPIAVANYKDFDVYQTRTERSIPVLICSPVG